MGAATENTADGSSRAMRGALLFLLLGGAVGAAIGWSTGSVCYRAQALVYIAPPVPLAADPGPPVRPRFEAVLDAQVGMLKSARLASLALTTDAWMQDGEAGMDTATFLEQRRIMRGSGAQHVQVQFLHGQPEIALAGVQALLTVYKQLFPELKRGQTQIESLRAQIEVLQGKLKMVQDRIVTLTTDYGGVEGLLLRHKAGVQELKEAERLLAEVRRALQAGGTPEQLEELKKREQRLAAHVETLRAALKKLTEARGELRRLQKETTSLQNEIKLLTMLKTKLELQSGGTEPIHVVDRGSLPTEPFEDSRSAHALRGFGFGALPGLLLLLLFTLSGRRAAAKVG